MKFIQGLKDGTIKLVEPVHKPKQSPSSTLVILRDLMATDQLKATTGRKQLNVAKTRYKLRHGPKKVAAADTTFKRGSNAQRIIQNVLLSRVQKQRASKYVPENKDDMILDRLLKILRKRP